MDKQGIKLAIVYDPECPKLRPDAYSQCYRDQFLALAKGFDKVRYVTSDCDDIDTDCLVYYDIHSSQEITVKGKSKVRYEYFNDPWQAEFTGKYNDGGKVHKLSAKQRSERAMDRGVDYIICPYENLFYRFIAPHCDIKLLWFPVAPDKNRCVKKKKLADRKPEVLLNGHIWHGANGFHPYAFRNWAYKQDGITKKLHSIFDKSVPSGSGYPNFLSGYAGALALCDTHICPKYSEIPLAGCVCFAQYLYDYEKMGFKDGESCIYVTKGRFGSAIKEFKAAPQEYQAIADNGRKLIEDNWTADHFAKFIYKHAEEHLLGGNGWQPPKPA